MENKTKCPRCKKSLNKNRLTYEGRKEFVTVCVNCGYSETKPKSMDEINPNDLLIECPFCLEKGSNLTFEHGENWARVNCIDCNVSMEYTRKDGESIETMCTETMDKWNKRYKLL